MITSGIPAFSLPAWSGGRPSEKSNPSGSADFSSILTPFCRLALLRPRHGWDDQTPRHGTESDRVESGVKD